MNKHRTATGFTNEAQTIAKLVTFLNERGCRVWRHPNTGTFKPETAAEIIFQLFDAVKAGNLSKPLFEKAVKNALSLSWGPTMCQIKGTPDIIGFDSFGRILGLEVKLGGDAMRAEQTQFQAEIESVGGHFYVVRDFNTFSHYWGLYENRHRPQGRPGLPSFKSSRGQTAKTLF